MEDDLHTCLELLSGPGSLGRELTVLRDGRLVDLAVDILGLIVLLDARVELGELVGVLGRKRAAAAGALLLGVDDVLEKLLTLSDGLVAAGHLLLDGGGDVQRGRGARHSQVARAAQDGLADLGSLVEVLKGDRLA